MDEMKAHVKTGISTRRLSNGKRWDFHLRNPEGFHAAIGELAGQLQVDLRQIICGKQVHGSKICKIDKVGKTFQLLEGYDCLMTDQTEVVLATFHADCLPIYLYDPEHHAIAMVHAGWRGTVAGIAGEAVEAMSRAYGTRPEKLFAKIGSCISQVGYEVDKPVIQACQAITGRTGIKESRPGYANLNLAAINREILIRNGVINEKIQEDQRKTDQNPDLFYSYRREGKNAGRMLAWIYLTFQGKDEL